MSLGRVEPALLIVAAFSRHDDAVAFARRELEARYGPVVLESAAYEFTQTPYYFATMGDGLRKRLWAFRDAVALDALPDVKNIATALEASVGATREFAERRPVNLDPGYLIPGKFVLASTKDHAHRLYLRDGVWAEVTLHWQRGAWRGYPWTFADYLLPEVTAFLAEARAEYGRRFGF